jgi:hypothetical protein
MGASSLKLLAVQGRTPQLPLEPGDETLLGVAMAQVMGHVALELRVALKSVTAGLGEAASI